MTRRPITARYVTVNSAAWSSADIAWAGFRWARARFLDGEDDVYLSVPWMHPDEIGRHEEWAWFRIRLRNPSWRFVQARNGAWVIATDAAPDAQRVAP